MKAHPTGRGELAELAGRGAGLASATLVPMTKTLFDQDGPGDRPRAGAGMAAGWFTAHCDGGARGNPGPAGFGAVIEDPGGRVAARLSRYLGRQTNNYAEYAGLLAALEWALENGVKWLKVVADSELMVNQMKGLYKVSSPTLRPLWQEAKRRTVMLERFEIGHTLRGGNREADRLANAAMDEGAGKSGVGGVSGVRGVSGVSKSASQQVSKLAGQSGAAGKAAEQRQVLEGYVKDGVVHLLDGELPEGAFVKVTRA
jgi:ribonuclease HI